MGMRVCFLLCAFFLGSELVGYSESPAVPGLPGPMVWQNAPLDWKVGSSGGIVDHGR